MNTRIVYGYETSCYKIGTIYKACTTETCLRMHTGEVAETNKITGIFDRTPIYAEVGIFCLSTNLRLPPKPLYHGLLYVTVRYECTASEILVCIF
jgi:hypothetical protein